MANTVYMVEEIRFDVRDEQVTQVYVLIKNLSNDDMPGVQGWHHKAFPARVSALEIMHEWAHGKEDPLLWPLSAPDQS